MSRAVFRVVATGPHASIQDAGRPGLMRYGVPASGPMDRGAFHLGRLALGAPAGAAAIEVSLGGLVLDCVEGSASFAVTGGGFVVEAGTRQLGSWSLARIGTGERLAIRPGPWGTWCYLGFAGRLVASRWLGSAATHALSGLGGGRLAAGQELVVEGATVLPAAEGPVPCPVWARPRAELAVVLGPQQRYFPAAAVEALLATPFRLTDAYDRMGVRLAGPPLTPEGALSIPSAPVLRGSIQVAGDGVATVLLADHQTTGGYPRIATVVDADLDGFTQLRPRERVSFRAVSPEEAVAIARSRARARAAAFARYS